ncbi:MAG: aspartate/glutamate racemase family protein [Spirochaetales bacterium]|nr:aspartate/glutamate racemase family protein [Spirochaetales bacterium]
MPRIRVGVLDSGVGGLTVVRSLIQKRAPFEILYFGDNANMPYGNRTSGEIVGLAKRMLDFLAARGIQAAAVACNTIAPIVDRLEPAFPFPILDIVKPAAEQLARRGEPEIGLFATEFTVYSGMHTWIAHAINPDLTIHGVSSRHLAALIDASPWDEAAIRAEINSMVEAMRVHRAVRTILLGCTHYPIVLDMFEEAAPEMEFLDPADLQAEALLSLFQRDEALAADGTDDVGPVLDIYTTGNPAVFQPVLERLGIGAPRSLQIVPRS